MSGGDAIVPDHRRLWVYAGMFVTFSWVLFSCESQKSAPEMEEERSFTEQNDLQNDHTTENTGLVIDGEQWMELKGSFSNGKDKDAFLLDIDPELFDRKQSDTTGSYRLTLEINLNNEPLNQLDKEFFPLQAMVFNDTENRPPLSVKKAALQPIKLQKGDSKIKFQLTAENLLNRTFQHEIIYSLKLK